MGIAVNYREQDHKEQSFWECIHDIFQTPPPLALQCGEDIVQDGNARICDQAGFVSRFQHALYRTDRTQKNLALLLLQADAEPYDKTANQRYPDNFYQPLIASRIINCLRRSDSLMEFSNGRFAVLLEDIGDPGTIPFAIEKIKDALSFPFVWQNEKYTFSLCCGVSVFPDDGYLVHGLWKSASVALQRAHLRGAGAFEFSNHELDSRATEKMAMSIALQRAVQNKEFELRFQPLVDVGTGKVLRVESLLRWNHPEQGILRPERFLHLLEETGLIVPLGEWIIETTYRYAYHMRQAGHQNMRFSVNVSPRQFTDPGFLPSLNRVLNKVDYEPSVLEFECAEAVLLKDLSTSRALINALEKLGIQVSIDNFGLDAAAPTELLRLPLCGLKIDRSLIRRVPFDRTYKAVTSGILTLAEGVGLRVAAAGVENVDQLKFLREHHCQEAQGYLFARPMSAVDLEHWLPN